MSKKSEFDKFIKDSSKIAESNLQAIKEQAYRELHAEKFREAVDLMKQKLKRRRWWHNLLPFKVVIIRRDLWK